MSENTPRRPDGMGENAGTGSSTPRVEIEQTPRRPEDDTAKTTQMPGGSSTDGGASAGGQGSKPGTTEQVPFVPSTETVTRTVVKTKAKALPVFLASLGGLVVGAVLVIALAMTGAFRITNTDVEPASNSVQTIDIDPEDTTLAEAVSAKALPSVVSIATTTSDGGGIGSGVILDTDGNIITNYHVIEGAQSIVVTLDDGTTYEADVVGSDESSDLAVIRLKDADASALTPIEVGDSDNLTVGEWVMAIGSPFGNEQSVSTGIVSALYRSTAMQATSGTTIYANMIQTDAAINPGNSGGALVNDEGKLIGINSIIESYSGSSSGVGFAIPVNYAINIANQIIDGKTPVHPYLGVSVTSVNALSARQQGLSTSSGAQIAAVTEGGPAAEAGIQEGDIVTAIDGNEVTSADGLIIALREHEVGDKVTLTINRDGKDQDVDVTLGSDEALQSEQQDNTTGNGAGNSLSEEELRQYLEDLLGGNQGYGQNGGQGF
ncbi:trypsin-like peptidase domain-containing protein [Collinsella sp. An2]|uniref:S1C family serine protease n=1 Tax=Collinsella sp. An2 TaxID=1965585 RepID=UPI000B377ACA|nr:trypsin-like peptidase domain-containing protein [Collinsella sp. An2]OUP09471.1 hypothetical protein B5F33_04705 [Collinsella sp. An2]